MKIAPRDINGFVTKVRDDIRAVLLHGSDVGLMRERALIMAKQVCEDLDDVFAVTRLDGDQISSDPAALGDAAGQIAMTAPRRLVMVRGRGTEMTESCKGALATLHDSAFIIVEASETTTRHALVKLFETTAGVASIGCYPDEAGAIADLVNDILKRDNITISREAKALLVSRLGSDRAATRGEIEKLALLAGPGGTLEYDEVSQALGDSAAVAITDIAVAAAEGRVENLERAMEKARAEQQATIMLLRGCQNYFRQLLQAGLAMKLGGRGAGDAVRTLRPPVHFRMQDRMAGQIRKWSCDMLLDAVNRLQDAELAIKSGMVQEDVYCAQTLLGICLRGRKLSR